LFRHHLSRSAAPDPVLTSLSAAGRGVTSTMPSWHLGGPD